MNDLGDTNKMVDTPRTHLQDRLLSMVHAFHDDHRKYAVRLLANDVADLEHKLNAANDRIKRLEQSAQEIDKEWFQVIESILGFHPVSMTEALRIGIERIKKQKQRIKRLEEAGGRMADVLTWSAAIQYKRSPTVAAWRKAKEAKP